MAEMNHVAIYFHLSFIDHVAFYFHSSIIDMLRSICIIHAPPSSSLQFRLWYLARLFRTFSHL